jgi:release factor glutamine methyltransferase
LLIQFLETQSVKGKKILELGSGSGLIAMLVSKRGAIVTASDINQTAVENGIENSQRNKLSVSFIHSNLFQSLSGEIYDMIIINPPYYPKDPVGESQYAWYCGKNFDYFHALFDQLYPHLTAEGQAFMILSDDCDIAHIETIAHEASFRLKKVYEQKLWSEDNYIFELVHSSTIKKQNA